MGKPVKRNVENLTEANFDRIDFTLFFRKHLFTYREISGKKWNHAVLIYDNDSVGIGSI